MALAPDHPLSIELADERSRRSPRSSPNAPGSAPARRRSRRPRSVGYDTGLRCRNPLDRRPGAAGLRRQLRADGLRHRRDLRLPGARPARPRVRAQIRPAGHPGGAAAGRRRRSASRSATRPTSGDGRLINSDFLDGLDVAAAKQRGDRAARGAAASARARSSYRLRDWGVSRQRYWGCPIPVIHCAHCGIVPVPREQLPVTLPRGRRARPAGQPARPPPDLEARRLPALRRRRRERETDTFDTFVESSLVLPALLLAARRGGVRARRGRVLDAGRPVHRRHRARGPAPALFALLHPRAEAVRLSRPRRAVRRPVHPGHGLPRDLPRRATATGCSRTRSRTDGRRVAGAATTAARSRSAAPRR